MSRNSGQHHFSWLNSDNSPENRRMWGPKWGMIPPTIIPAMEGPVRPRWFIQIISPDYHQTYPMISPWHLPFIDGFSYSKIKPPQKKTWNPWYVHEIPIISPWYHHFSWLYPSSPTIIHISPGAHHLTAQKTSLQPCTCRWRSTPCRHGSNRNLGHHLGGSRNWGTSKALNHQLQNDGFSMKQSIQLIIGVPVKWKPLI